MRMPRFTIRRMMLVIAAVAICTGVAVETRRLLRLSAGYAQSAATARAKESSFQKKLELSLDYLKDNPTPHFAGISDSGLYGIFGGADTQRTLHAYESRFDYYRALRSKYERAARYPWLSVEPDRPAPK